MKLDLERSNGYSIGVEGWGHNVKLTVVRQTHLPPTIPFHSSAVEYLTQGTVRRGRMRATFPGLGEINVKFKPSRDAGAAMARISRARDGVCEVVQSTERSGAFVGTIDFTGEDNYISVHTYRAKGMIGRPPGVKGCNLEETPPTPPSRERLAEQSDSPGRSLSFEVEPISINSAAQRPLFFAAGLREEKEMMTIVRTVLAIGSANNVLVANPNDPITVLPPPPFSGSGVFQTSADRSTSGTGSLAVRFLGVGERVGLVGPQFSGTFSW